VMVAIVTAIAKMKDTLTETAVVVEDAVKIRH